MKKKRTLLIRVSRLLLFIAPVIFFNVNSFIVVGEPSIPENLKI